MCYSSLFQNVFLFCLSDNRAHPRPRQVCTPTAFPPSPRFFFLALLSSFILHTFCRQAIKEVGKRWWIKLPKKGRMQSPNRSMGRGLGFVTLADGQNQKEKNSAQRKKRWKRVPIRLRITRGKFPGGGIDFLIPLRYDPLRKRHEKKDHHQETRKVFVCPNYISRT